MPSLFDSVTIGDLHLPNRVIMAPLTRLRAGQSRIHRGRSVVAPVPSRDDLESLAVGLLQAEMPMPKSVRLLGVSLSSLQASDLSEPQLDLPI
jgi:hypothetical protein